MCLFLFLFATKDLNINTGSKIQLDICATKISF